MIALECLLLLAFVLTAASAYTAHRILTGNGRVPLTKRPETFGLPYEAVSCRTADGLTLKGWFVPAKSPSSRTLLLCHGWGTNKGEILKFTHGLTDRGFNLLFFDSRCCGESEGAMLSIGYLESRDFDAEVEFLKSYRPGDSYGVSGLSMGAMTSFCGLTRHDGFKAAVLESPFPSHDLAARRYLRYKYGIPNFPLVEMALFWMRLRLGSDPEAVCPEMVAARFKSPLLAISGGEDRMAPAEIIDGFLMKLKVPTQAWVVPGAGHGRCAEIAGQAYTDRLASFYLAHMS